MKRYGRVYNPFSGYDIYPDDDGKYVKYQDVEQLEKDFKELCDLVADVKANFPDVPTISSIEPLKIGDAYKVKEYVENLISECDELDGEVTYLREYTDHLVSFSKLPCLPKDLENLREANLKFVEENISLRLQNEINLEIYCSEIERLEGEISGWKNKWECALELAAIAENKLEAIREYLN